MANPYKLFISHSWSYSDDYERFCGLLDEARRFEYQDYSVPRNDPVHNTSSARELEDAILKQMRFCHVVIFLAGKYATYSKWITREINIANGRFTNPKPILAVKPYASTQVSSTVRNNADRLVNWSTSSVVSAIRELA